MRWIPQTVLRKCKVSTKERSRDDKGQRDRDSFIRGKTGGKKGDFSSPAAVTPFYQNEIFHSEKAK
jgi:hypothetical protein